MTIFFRICLITLILLLGITLAGMLTGNDDLNLLDRTGLIRAQEAGDEEESGDDDDIKPAETVLHEGLRAVRLAREQQLQSGIRTERIKSITLQHEYQAFSRVIDLQPLFDLRSEYLQARAAKNIEQVRYNNTRKTLEQLVTLNRETSNVPSRRIRELEAELQLLRENISAHDLRLENLKSKIVQTWGAEIADMVLDGGSDLTEQLLDNRQVLLLLSLKPGQALREDIRFIHVNRIDDRPGARKAWIVSPGTHVDPVLQGETYFLRTDAEKLRVGMKLYSWIKTGDRAIQGVIVPGSAIVWYAGQPWVYVKVEDDLFARKALVDPVTTGSSVVVENNLQAGDEVVVTGGQILLSEEYRLQIPDEDDD